MAGFAESILRNIARVQKEIDAKCFAIFNELASQVVYNCPTLRGNLINDFWPASNAYNLTTQTRVDAEGQSDIQAHSDTTGSGSISRIRDVQAWGRSTGRMASCRSLQAFLTPIVSSTRVGAHVRPLRVSSARVSQV
jgi:hypothetical protein